MSRAQLLLLALCVALLGACAGPRASRPELPLAVVFEGRAALDEDELLQALALALEGVAPDQVSKSTADDAAWEVERHYQRRGFAFAAVEYEWQAEPEPRAVLRIVEGPRCLLEQVAFSGNASFKDDELRPFFESSGPGLLEARERLYVAEDVEDALQEIAALYRGRGWLEVRVGPAEVRFDEARERATLSVAIAEGRRFTLGSVTLEVEGDEPAGAPSSPERCWQQELAGPFRERLVVALAGRIEDLWAEQGFADARVRLLERSFSLEGAVALVFRVVPGPRVRIATVHIRGNESTMDAFVRSRLELEQGQRYSRRAERASLDSLHSSGLFERAALRLTPTPDAARSPEGDELRELEVELLEARSLELFIEPGYGSYEQLRLAAGLRERNLFGTGRILDARGSISLLAQSGKVSLIDPWFLGSDVTADLSLFGTLREEPSFERREVGVGVGLRRRFTARIEGAVGYQFRRSDVSQTDIADPDLTADVDISEVMLSPTWDSRDSVFEPREGTFVRLILEQASAALGSQLEFTRARLLSSVFFPLARGTVLALSARVGLIAPQGGTDTIPLQERFFNGGENSVRSFREAQLGPRDAENDPLGGEAFTTFSVELRQRLAGRLEGALFLDVGNVQLDWRDVLSFDDLRSGIGLGLRYSLPVGPIRLDGALNPDAQDGEASGALHLSVGMAF